MIRLTLFVIGLLLGGATVSAADPAGREVVDIAKPPWNAVVKVQTSLAKKCTGVLVAPRQVLTAAHCLINQKTRRLMPADSLHVLTGFDRGGYLSHHTVARYSVDAGYDAAAPKQHFMDDWAVLTLDVPVTEATPLGLAAKVPSGGTPVAVAGYYGDRNQILMADENCLVTGGLRIGSAYLIRHDCALSHGTSGGPLLIRSGDGWAVSGLNVAESEYGMLAVPVEVVAPALRAAEAAPH